MDKKIFTRDFGGRALRVEVGELAQQANGSVLVTYGDSTVLATAVLNPKTKERCDYLPLTVDYEEKLYAAGKIKGSRFIKREGRAQDSAITKGRFIDRTLRPRFNQAIRNEIQVAITVLSYDKANDTDVLGILAASLALSISDIPWDGPVAGVRVGRAQLGVGRQDSQFIINPTFEERVAGDLEIVVAGTAQKINMMEAGAKELPEEEMLAAIAAGQKANEELITFQNEIIAELKPQKKQLEIKSISAELKNKVGKFLEDKLDEAIFAKEKHTRQNRLGQLHYDLVKFIRESETEEVDDKVSLAASFFEERIDATVHTNILKNERRPDNRKLNEVRELSCRVGVLARTHGSALFNRGNTQALATVTLGSPGDKQIIDGLEEEYKKRFIHHYNFPPFSVGETGGFRGPGRREIGHGALAERVLMQLIPDEKDFPYTIRVVSEILSSNGSSSMASVCGSSLALMDAGVPIKSPAAGIAMGLMIDTDGKKYKVLTDIQGPEDHHGDMDCKIAGTAQGVCGLQMDVKIEGVDLNILRDTLAQAKEARLHILQCMNNAIATARPNLSPFAPRIITIQINPDKIRDVIGPGGKVINEITAQTGVKIDIEDSGLIFVTSIDEASAQKAVEWIKNLTHEVTAGEIYQGKVTRLINFGAFVEILPGQEGLVHISELAPFRVERVDDIVKVGDSVTVKVKNIDDMGRINLTMRNTQKNNFPENQ
ncbi:polyribonucleotide nucleotidyltransferase [Patescibacteria group bacterium]|nr:polyribonucleotide nucleotidyltransferase [Patescibacteria group bacterium]